MFAPDFKSSTGNTVNYSSVGSGAGITAITNKTVDFGASDAPLTSSQISACGCVEIAWALSATGPSFNLPGVTHLNVSGPILAGIYMGQITMWNDPAIAKINKGTTLPAMKIVPVYRSDGSGDTFAFTEFLSHSDSGVGEGGRLQHRRAVAVGHRHRREGELRRRRRDLLDARRDRLRLDVLRPRQQAASKPRSRTTPASSSTPTSRTSRRRLRW